MALPETKPAAPLGDALAAAEALTSAVRFYDPFQLPEPTPEEQNPLALFRGGWLRKGGGAMIVSTTGRGKSTFMLQGACRWAAGLEFFGIAPLRPLRILFFQFENDDEEMKWFMVGIRGGAFPGMSADEAAQLAAGRLRFVDGVEATVDAVIVVVKREMAGAEPPDLVVIDPVLAVADGDLSKQEYAHELFYRKLNSMVKKLKVGLVLSLHTGKPPANASDRAVFRGRDLAEYLGFGSSLIADWFRAVLVLMPSKADGYFRLIGAKRGRNLGWTGPDGKRTLQRFVGWSKEGNALPYWRDVDPDEFREAEAQADLEDGGAAPRHRGGKSKATTEDVEIPGTVSGTKETKAQRRNREREECFTLATLLIHEPGGAASAERLREIAEQKFGRADGRKIRDRLVCDLAEYNCAVVEVGNYNAKFYAAGDTAEAAAEKAQAAADDYLAKRGGAKT